MNDYLEQYEFRGFKFYVHIDYLPLLHGETILIGDYFFDIYCKTLNEIRPTSPSIGVPFNKNVHFPFFRKTKFNYNYSKQKLEEAINYLKSSRAFNADSATKVTEEKFHLYKTLANKGLINVFDSKFYLRK